MANSEPEQVTLTTVHQDLRVGFADLKTEMRAGFADLKVTLITGFQSLPTREQNDEMIRLLRENNRIQEERFTQLNIRIREQHLETQQVLHLVAEGQRVLVDGQQALIEGQRALFEEIRTLSAEVRGLSLDIKALIARLDALIKGRGDGSPS